MEQKYHCVFLKLLSLPVPHGPYLGLWAHRICGGWGSPDVGSVWPLSPPPAARPEAGHFLPLLSLWLAGGAETSWAGDEGNERGASALSRERLRAS